MSYFEEAVIGVCVLLWGISLYKELKMELTMESQVQEGPVLKFLNRMA